MEPVWVPPAYRNVAFTLKTSVTGPRLSTVNRTLWVEPPVHDSPPLGDRRETDDTGVPPSVEKSCVAVQSASGFPQLLMSVAVQPKLHT